MAAPRFFKDEQFDFETRIALGCAHYRGSEVGEVLSTIGRIDDGDVEAWFREWTATGERLAATADGVMDVSTSWTDHLPARMRAQLDEGRSDRFDRDMALGLRFSPTRRRTMAFRMRPYGTDDPYEAFRAVREYHLRDQRVFDWLDETLGPAPAGSAGAGASGAVH